jgi:phosphate-selective porin OprO/OprP
MELRRARLYLSGTMHQHVEFKWQYDFAKGAVGHRDVYAGLFDLGDWIPNVRAGHQYEPFGLDSLTSSNDSTFVERALVSNTFSPNRNPGFLLWKNLKDGNGEERFTWAAGLFREDSGDNSVSSNDGAHALTARVTGTPFWVDKGRKMLHLGLAATRREVAGRGSEGVTFSARPEADLLNTFLSTGRMAEADTDSRYGAELAFLWREFSVQGEYMITRLEMNDAAALDDPGFHGGYLQLAWTLTGEARRWKPAEAIFQNPKPYANAFENGGTGAWEVALRLSQLDLSDGSIASGGVEGGTLDVYTLGLNWYLNPNVRVMWDLSRADLSVDDPLLGRGGDATIAQMRVQVAL